VEEQQQVNIPMKIEIEPQAPDGLNVTITNIICDTHNEVFEIIKLCEAIQQGHKIDMEECIGIFKGKPAKKDGQD
jgi:hypothetical protein